MARGQQKIQSQQRNAKKQADLKKQSGHDQKAAAAVALKHNCLVCKSQMPDLKVSFIKDCDVLFHSNDLIRF